MHETAAPVSREADRWVVALAVEAERDLPATNGAADILGVDLGVLALATLSDGRVVAGPKALRRGLRKLRRLSRAHSRTVRGSRNRSRSARRLARHHARVAAIRRDHLHTLTTTLAKTHGRIVVEDLNVRGMVRTHQVARSLADAGFAEFRCQLAYKCGGYGSRLVVADRWFPSSKRCSRCGTVKAELSLSERTFRCDACGLGIGRDVNAAINLAWWADHHAVTASAAETQTACGADVRPGAILADRTEAGTGTAPEPTGLRVGGLEDAASCPLFQNGIDSPLAGDQPVHRGQGAPQFQAVVVAAVEEGQDAELDHPPAELGEPGLADDHHASHHAMPHIATWGRASVAVGHEGGRRRAYRPGSSGAPSTGAGPRSAGHQRSTRLRAIRPCSRLASWSRAAVRSRHPVVTIA